MSSFTFKFRMAFAVLRSRNAVVITNRGYWSSVSVYDDDQFWKFAKRYVGVLKTQHYAEKKRREEPGS